MLIEPATGDAIVKKETITYEQMREEFKQNRLSHNPEMNVEFRKKWHVELSKYLDSKYQYKFFDNSLSEPATYVEPEPDNLEDDEEFQKLMHEKLCINLKKALCKPCEDKHREDNQIIKKMMNWSNDLFNSDKVAFIYKELCDGYQAGDVKLVYHEDKDWRDRSPDLHEKYVFNETITHANFDEVIAKHTPLAKEWFERCKNEDLERNTQSKP